MRTSQIALCLVIAIFCQIFALPQRVSAEPLSDNEIMLLITGRKIISTWVESPTGGYLNSQPLLFRSSTRLVGSCFASERDINEETQVPSVWDVKSSGTLKGMTKTGGLYIGVLVVDPQAPVLVQIKIVTKEKAYCVLSDVGNL
ncbi:MAG: hypothetical protein SFV17_05305 [Candidatus Obscuribacter sp.]|nr:hypothetical protein [Candidatus Obscuribacter sp.]